MIKARINKEKAVPLWAAIGAPVIGVPLMVALLALATPAESTPVGEPETGLKTEQVEIQTANKAIEADCLVEPLKQS